MEEEEIANAFRLVKNITGLNEAQVMMRSRTNQSVRSRQIISYYLRKHTRITQEEIGSILKKNHATVRHGAIKLEEEASTDPLMKDIKRCLDSRMENPIYEMRNDIRNAVLKVGTIDNNVDEVYRIILKNINLFKEQQRVSESKTLYDNALRLQAEKIKELEGTIRSMKNATSRLLS